MTSGLESQVVQALAGLLTAVVTAGVAYLAPKIKGWLAAHTASQTSAMASKVIDGLASIADSVVANFNQQVVVTAKVNGTWTPALAAQIKAEAVKAVQSQGAALVALGQTTVGDVQGLIGSLVEHAVLRHNALRLNVPPVTQASPTIDTAPAASASPSVAIKSGTH